jgi:hypothetical protein
MQSLPSGPHYQTLRLYFEGCEAMAAYQRGDRRWHSYMSRADILDRALKCRRLALTDGFFDLTAEQLGELADLDLADPQQALWRDDLLLHCTRRDEDDLYGQRLPASLFDLLRAIEEAPPYGNQGHNGETKKIRLGRTSHFAKLSYEMLVDPPPGQDERDSAACAAALHALQPDIAPHTVWHVIAANGQHCMIAPAMPGRVYADPAKAYPRVHVTSLQWIVLAEWIFGMADRHRRNLLISDTLHTASMIDLAPCWRFQPGFLGWSTLEGTQRECNSWARELWGHHDPSLMFPDWLLFAAVRHEEAVLAALQPFPLEPAIVAHVRERFAILRAVSGRDIGLEELEQKAQAWYTPTQGG